MKLIDSIDCIRHLAKAEVRRRKAIQHKEKIKNEGEERKTVVERSDEFN